MTHPDEEVKEKVASGEKEEVEKEEEPEKEPEKVEPEKSELDKKRDEILKDLGEGGEEEKVPPEGEEKEEKKEKEEEKEEEEVTLEETEYWEKLKEENPKLKDLDYKDLRDYVTRTLGGIERFDKDAKIVSALEKAGYDLKTPEGRKQFYEKLETGKGVSETARPETITPPTFKQARLSGVVRQALNDPNLVKEDAEGNPVHFKDWDKKDQITHVESVESVAETLMPSIVPEMAREARDRVSALEAKVEWRDYQLKTLLEKNKDDVIEDSVRKDIIQYFKKYPKSRDEIVQRAKQGGENPWEALHADMIRHSEGYGKAKEEKIRKEEEAKARKREATKSETSKRKGESPKSTKFETLPMMEKRKKIMAEG